MPAWVPSWSTAVDRLRNRAERRRDTEALPDVPVGADERRFVRELALDRHGYRVDEAWEEWLHRALGAAWPCAERERFGALWATLAGELDGAPVPGTLWDADAGFARAAFCAASHSGARRAVETGVARGITSRCLLEALGDDGRLWSIDLLPNDPAWALLTRTAVPPDLAGRWTYVEGSSRRRLVPLLREIEPIDVFVHDSHHTGSTMRFELGAAWPHLMAGGVLLCDDVQENRAFAELVEGLPREQWAVGQEEDKAALFGIAVRPAGPVRAGSGSRSPMP